MTREVIHRHLKDLRKLREYLLLKRVRLLNKMSKKNKKHLLGRRLLSHRKT
jgi:hypothetical protein